VTAGVHCAPNKQTTRQQLTVGEAPHPGTVQEPEIIHNKHRHSLHAWVHPLGKWLTHHVREGANIEGNDNPTKFRRSVKGRVALDANQVGGTLMVTGGGEEYIGGNNTKMAACWYLVVHQEHAPDKAEHREEQERGCMAWQLNGHSTVQSTPLHSPMVAWHELGNLDPILNGGRPP